jgi:hypothetical protein
MKAMRSDCMIDTEATEFGGTGDRHTAKLGSGWSSYELWKTTIHEPREQGLVRKPTSLAQQLDEAEDRLLIRQRKRYARGVWIALLLILASAMALVADRHHAESAESSVTQGVKQIIQPHPMQMPVDT